MEVNFTIETIALAARIMLAQAGERKVFALHGEMGAGKTTFIHTVCEILGVREAITSPTFSIINQYISAQSESIYHIDLYRLKDDTEAVQAGVEDCLESGNYCFVEWPEKAASLFPRDTAHLYIELINNHTRKLTINL